MAPADLWKARLAVKTLRLDQREPIYNNTDFGELVVLTAQPTPGELVMHSNYFQCKYRIPDAA